MNILGIESSCDDCCIAIVRDGKEIICEKQYSQEEVHAPFGGVVPEIAARAHTRTMLPLFLQLLDECGYKNSDIDAVAVTTTPGLHNSLVVGRMFAESFSYALQIPCVHVNHLYAHLYAAQIRHPIAYPHLGVIVSGGHTLFGTVRAYNTYEILGSTVDDACGEAFDKIAAHLHLEYPGGSKIEEMAKRGNPDAASLPDAHVSGQNPFNVSYSGLKTAVIHQLAQFWNTDYPMTPENIAATFQKSALRMITDRIRALITHTQLHTIVCGGGVFANRTLAHELAKITPATFHIPPPALCTDNATMVAGIGYQYVQDA